MLKMMQTKYEAAMKEKMLVKLERDRLASRVGALEAQLRQVEAARAAEGAGAAAPAAKEPKGPRVSRLPEENRANPYLTMDLPAPKVERWGLSKTFNAHTLGVADVAAHPTKPIVATASDDGARARLGGRGCLPPLPHSLPRVPLPRRTTGTWKMFSLPQGELIMSGEGHKDWLSSVDFSPRGSHLVTGSGDATVKVWAFAQAKCVQTLAEHTGPVWDVAYHDCGDFVVSASMDQSAKLWDVVTGKAKQAFRGHVDSVNSVCFQPFSNTIATGSGDKTVSLWDCRSGLCVQTFYGHQNAVNDTAFAMRGDVVASTDADGQVRLWDVRMVAEIATINCSGPQGAACNGAAFDASGKSLAVCCDDGKLRFVDVEARALGHETPGHNDPVSAAVFDRKGKYLVTAGADCTFRLFC